MNALLTSQNLVLSAFCAVDRAFIVFEKAKDFSSGKFMVVTCFIAVNYDKFCKSSEIDLLKLLT